ncbi:MAG: DUF362 domain-containing protein [Desulfovibrio sp.]|nr:DUF362 domain-containing protein [Desulfovibrio sp.]
MDEKLVVALSRLGDYKDPGLNAIVGAMLDKAFLPSPRGLKILVKPNLLLARELACSHPAIVAAVCRWLLDNGAKIVVGDSPAFGSARYVSGKIGLLDALKPLGLDIVAFNRARDMRVSINYGNYQKDISFKVATFAIEADEIYSVAKVKAHSQTRITLCAKNCFGCVIGWRKALVHALHGKTTEIFAECLAGLFRNLPPVRGVCDGVVAMSETGPSKGSPYSLNLLGASNSATALDESIIAILGRPLADFPLASRLASGNSSAGNQIYTLLKPEDFDASGFKLPSVLKPTSFSPPQLMKSFAKRFWMAIRKI